jgi:hypothetical protein
VHEDRPEEEMQLDFVSGQVKIKVVSTPIAFATYKAFHSSNKRVTDLETPITIRMPLKHDRYIGMGYDEIAKHAKCIY